MPDEFGHVPGSEMSKEEYQKDLRLGHDFEERRKNKVIKVPREQIKLAQEILKDYIKTTDPDLDRTNNTNARLLHNAFHDLISSMNNAQSIELLEG